MGPHQEAPTAPPGPNCGWVLPLSLSIAGGLYYLFTPGTNLTSLLSTTVFQMNYNSANRRFFPGGRAWCLQGWQWPRCVLGGDSSLALSRGQSKIEDKKAKSVLSLVLCMVTILLCMVTEGMVNIRVPKYQRGILVLSLRWNSQGTVIRAQLSLDLWPWSLLAADKDEVGERHGCFNEPSLGLICLTLWC